MTAANAFGTLPTLAWCLLILTGSAWLGYALIIDALDGWVDRAGRSWETPEAEL